MDERNFNLNPLSSLKAHRITQALCAFTGAVFLSVLFFTGWKVFPGMVFPKGISQFRNVLIPLALLWAVALPWVRHSLPRPEKWIPGILGFYLLAYLKSAFLDYAALEINALDFSMYDFAMRSTLQGHFMESVLGTNHFGTHATPILFLLIPLHAIFHTPLFSLFAHPVILWAGALALNLVLGQAKVSGWSRLGILFAYLNCVLLSRTLGYSFHVEVFYPLAIFLFIFCVQAEETRKGIHLLRIALSLLFLLSIKEDAPFYACGLIAAFYATGKLSLRKTAGLLALALATAAFYLKFLIPHFSETQSYALVGAAADFGNTPLSSLRGALGQPEKFVLKFIHGGWWAFLLPSFGLLLVSPWFWIAALPFLLITSLVGNGLMLGLSLYYGMPLVPVLFYGWIVGWKYWRHSLRPPALRNAALAIPVLALCLTSGGYLVFRAADLGKWASLRAFTRVVPEEGKICAPGSLIPQLPYRETVRMIDFACLEDAEFAIVTDAAAPGQRKFSDYPLSETEMDDVRAFLEGSPLWTMTGNETGFTAFQRNR